MAIGFIHALRDWFNDWTLSALVLSTWRIMGYNSHSRPVPGRNFWDWSPASMYSDSLPLSSETSEGNGIGVFWWLYGRGMLFAHVYTAPAPDWFPVDNAYRSCQSLVKYFYTVFNNGC